MDSVVSAPGLVTRPDGQQDLARLIHTGTLHVYVAFDWGEEVELDRARSLVTSEFREFPRRRRTPTSIGYRPLPLRLVLSQPRLEIPELGIIQAPAEVTVFDFGAVSIALHIPFCLPAANLLSLAGWLAEPTPLVRVARSALEPVHKQLLQAIINPAWPDDLSEEYFVFQFTQPCTLPSPQRLEESLAGWLAGMVRLEAGPLSCEEITEALRLYLRYRPEDLLVLDWAAAVLFDQDCEETLQIIEFANLQLLEFRHIDNRLDDSLARAYKVIHPLTRSWLPFWRSQARSLRQLGELKVEADGLFERTGNVLKLVGDQYLARVYHLLAARFHLEEWEKSIQRKLEVAEGAYRVVADQSDTYRAEFLELTVVFLIFLEIVLAFLRR